MPKILLTFFILFFLFSCGQKEEKKEQAPQPEKIQGLKLEKATFSDLKNWKKDKTSEILSAFKDSCSKIKFKKTEFIDNHSAIKISTQKYNELCQKLNDKTEFKKFIEENFTPYLVTFDGQDQGKFTSYYESSLEASYTKDDEYKYPIYGRPLDLLEINIQDFDSTLPKKRLLGRLAGQKIIPYYTRSEIEKNGIKAPVILWGNNPVDIYIMQIQGSAVANLPNGEQIRIGYADNNGHTFKGIGSILLEKGLLKSGQASMDKIRQWLISNGEIATQNMAENKRYIFHRLNHQSGPLGAQNTTLISGRSLAVDTGYIPLGSILWLETTGPDQEKIEKAVLAQDIGGAIKGAIRGDYFWGSGMEILSKAGRMNSSGRYYILLPKENQENKNETK